jgi:hypothetical protein
MSGTVEVCLDRQATSPSGGEMSNFRPPEAGAALFPLKFVARVAACAVSSTIDLALLRRLPAVVDFANTKSR